MNVTVADAPLAPGHGYHSRQMAVLYSSLRAAVRLPLPERRYNGSHEDYGYAYPSAVVDRTAVDGGQMLIAYSVNKENIELMIVPLSVLAP